MANGQPPTSSKKWTFTRPGPPVGSSAQSYFHTNMREIAGRQPDYNLPWQDDLYLTYPALDKPDWPAFMAHVKQLNEEADSSTIYKIVYVMRRAHKTKGNILDPSLDETGKSQCAQLSANLERAMRKTGVPPPAVIATSPLARALQTTQLGVLPAFSRFSTPPPSVLVLDSLREQLDNGEKNRRHDKAWIARHFPDFDVGAVDPDNSLELKYTDSASGETYQELWPRVDGAFACLFEKFPEQLVVAVMSHCHAVMTVQREVTGWDVAEGERREKVEFYLGEAGAYAMLVKGVRS